MKVTKAPSLAPSSPSTSFSSTSGSSVHASEGVSISSRLDPKDSGTCHSKLEPELIALRVINEPEEAIVDMSTDLRADFKERHRKHLYETIDVVPPPAKKA